MLMSDGTASTGNKAGDMIIIRNAIIEGAWGFTVFFVGSSAAQLKLDPMAWCYGIIGSFLTGFLGYLLKAFKLTPKTTSTNTPGDTG